VCNTLQQCRPLFFGGFPPRRSWIFPNDCAAVRRLGNWGCSKMSMEIKLVNRSSDKQIESVTFRPKAER